MDTKWQGLWEQDTKGLFAGQVLKKAEIPKYTRIMLKNNKYYKKGTKRPKYVYCFADSIGYEDKCIRLELEKPIEKQPYKENGVYYTEEWEQLYTYDEVQYAINRATDDAVNGYTDNIVSDYL